MPPLKGLVLSRFVASSHRETVQRCRLETQVNAEMHGANMGHPNVCIGLDYALAG
jgi:hypothetical protein